MNYKIERNNMNQKEVNDLCERKPTESQTVVELQSALFKIERLEAKLLASEAAHNEAKEEIHHLQIELGQCERKCAQSEAAGAEMRLCIATHIYVGNHCMSCGAHAEMKHTVDCKIDHALSTPCGQSFLDERERHVKAIERLIPFAVAYRSHPLRNPEDKLDETLELARTALNRNEP